MMPASVQERSPQQPQFQGPSLEANDGDPSIAPATPSEDQDTNPYNAPLSGTGGIY
jgi:hypothetical protein